MHRVADGHAMLVTAAREFVCVDAPAGSGPCEADHFFPFHCSSAGTSRRFESK